MLTRDMLRYHVRHGSVQPRFVATDDAVLLQHAEALVQTVQDAVHTSLTREAVEETLAACLTPSVHLQVSRGLQKLLLDRCTFAEPEVDGPQIRSEVFARGTALLRDLPSGASCADFCTAWEAQLGPQPNLYADLPGARPLQDMKPLDPPGLLNRYNIAQVQGLVLACKHLTIRTPRGDLRALRRVLRWLKFCRLVAQVQRSDDGDWCLEITGPAEMFEHAKKYGLQLATFVPVVPLLSRYTLQAEVTLRPGAPWQLQLDESAPWVSPYTQKLGYAPPELQHIVKTFSDDAWQLDTQALPRAVGAQDMMLPDFTCRHVDGTRVHVELFHRWHQHALIQRLTQLAARPDTTVLLGIDKPLAARPLIAQALASHAAVPTFVFNTFPTAKRLRERLRAWEG